MDINALKAFIQVAELHSFSAAGEKLHLTQPAISKRISQLEAQLGVKLINRIGRSITLTQAGDTLLPRAKSILMELDDVRRQIKDLAGHVTGTLNLGISHHLGLRRLPPVLAEFSRTFPEVNLDIEFLDSEVAYEGVLSGKIQVGIITLAQDASPKVVTQKIWNDPLNFVVSPDHPLAGSKLLTLNELTHHQAILPGLHTFTGRLVKKLFDASELNLTVRMNTNYLETIKMMVSIGLGWSVLPISMLDEGLYCLAVENVHIERQLGAIYHKQRTLSNAALAFLDMLEKYGTD
jgi:DNA-binding transcriptional LysR family regulator